MTEHMNEKPLRVLVATGIYPPDIGGPATHLGEVLPLLRAAGDQVQVVTFADSASEGEEEGVRVVRISRAASALVRMWRYIRALRSAVRQADLMYVHDMSAAGLCAYLVSRASDVPYVLRLGGDYVWESAFQNRATDSDYLTFQGQEPGWYRIRRTLGTMIAAGAEAIIVPSIFLREVVVRWGIAPEKVRVVPNAVAPVASESAAGSELLAHIRALREKGMRVAVTSGRFVRRKHIETVIRAAAEAPDVHLFVIGFGPEEGRYREVIAECGVTNRVAVISSQTRAVLSAVLAAADVFVLLDEGETFSFISLESLLAGTPVILTRAGALEEVFGAYEGRGVVFGERSVAAVAACLRSPLPPRPPSGVREELAGRYSLDRHVAAVRAIMRGIYNS